MRSPILCRVYGPALGLIAALVAGLAAAPAPAPPPGVATVEFLDVGQGDAILIRSPEGKAALIDAGPSKEVVGLLRARGADHLDLVAVSHHHADHVRRVTTLSDHRATR